MKSLVKTTIMAGLVGLFTFVGDLGAVPAPNAGGGDAIGGGGSTRPDYGDLWILYRDGNGVPYVTPFQDGAGMCQQPLPSAACPSSCQTNGWADGVETDVQVVFLDESICGVPAECGNCTQEVEFERDNVIRARESVLDQQLEDATIKLATAACVTLDPAGRPVASNVVDDEVVWNTIDSPLQNLAFYKKLMQDGYVGGEDNPIDLLSDDWLESAARALGASFPKEGKGNVDMVVYMNEILGLTQDEESSLLCNPCLTQQYRKEVMGEVKVITKRFLDYAGNVYNRYNNFLSLPAPANIPEDTPTDGWFEYTELTGYDEFGNPIYGEAEGPTYDVVFGGTSYTGDLLTGFAQAADDTREVILYMHSWPILGDGATPPVCGNVSPDYFDIFISPLSGLKVPVRMAAAGDGREGMVIVENNGPAVAEGVTVMVTGEYSVDGIQEFVQLLDGMGGTEIFLEPMGVEPIEPGYSASIPFFFVMAESTEITWTATAYPSDVNPTNNEVTKTTIVTKPKGGGGGH